jgi:serine O-acetyltransferase
MSSLFRTMREDVRVVFERDPAAKSRIEVVLCYPGVHALWGHRIANGLWRRGWLLAARILSHTVRFLSGIEIHPGARVGCRVFIDHGAGVVIGETAEIGDECVLYQNITLGGVSLEKGKRHPTLGHCVVVGAGAKLLGPITIGDGARVGANSVVVHDVQAGTTVVGIPAKEVRRRDPSEAERISLHHERISDPLARALSDIVARIERLEGRSPDDDERGRGEPPPPPPPEETAS